MNEQNNGGPAFPVAYGGGRIEGMTLRDYFAAKATNSDIDRFMYARAKDCSPYVPTIYQAMSREEAKYAYADAMIKARG